MGHLIYTGIDARLSESEILPTNHIVIDIRNYVCQSILNIINDSISEMAENNIFTVSLALKITIRALVLFMEEQEF